MKILLGHLKGQPVYAFGPQKKKVKLIVDYLTQRAEKAEKELAEIKAKYET